MNCIRRILPEAVCVKTTGKLNCPSSTTTCDPSLSCDPEFSGELLRLHLEFEFCEKWLCFKLLTASRKRAVQCMNKCINDGNIENMHSKGDTNRNYCIISCTYLRRVTELQGIFRPICKKKNEEVRKQIHAFEWYIYRDDLITIITKILFTLNSLCQRVLLGINMNLAKA